MLWYSLEAPRRGASNEYHNVSFRQEIRKILCGYPLLSVAMICIKNNSIIPFALYEVEVIIKSNTIMELCVCACVRVCVRARAQAHRSHQAFNELI